jgi:phage terminase small subunit
VRENLEDIKEQNMRALEDEIIKAHQIAARLRQAIDDKKTIYKSWQQTLDDAEVTLYAALRIFRAENEKHRHDAMRPAYFDTLPRLAPVAITQSNLQQHENDYLEMLQTIKALDDNLQARKEKIHATFDQHVDQLNFIKSRQPTGAA